MTRFPDPGTSREEAMVAMLRRGCEAFPGAALQIQYWADPSEYDESSGWPKPPWFPAVTARPVD
ncbi:hypothetical protein [Spirillospora sp. CA-128828]|uniref:hypothetical protein n=1 Tax=Spirillospora sp. CA-128828 TaxID=3240033 RepID=UPI003D916EBD